MVTKGVWIFKGVLVGQTQLGKWELLFQARLPSGRETRPNHVTSVCLNFPTKVKDTAPGVAEPTAFIFLNTFKCHWWEGLGKSNR